MPNIKTFGMGRMPVWKDNEQQKVKLLLDLARLRHSQLNGHICVIDTGIEGCSSAQTSIDHQADVEFSNMEFVFSQIVESGKKFVTDEEAYLKVLTILVKALYSYHLLAGLKPLYDYKFPWPPACCTSQTPVPKEEVSVELKIAIEAGYAYLKQRNYRLAQDRLVGHYDWISFEPLL